MKGSITCVSCIYTGRGLGLLTYLIANRFIIDTLNDSVIDFLPEEGWEMLDRFLQHNEASVKRKSSLKFWKKEN